MQKNKQKQQTLRCKTKYPVFMVHGAGFRDDSIFYNYWGRIPKALESEGAELYYGGQDAWGSIEYNAGILKKKILDVVSGTGVEKFNIIAHSRGGLEARYLINELKMDKYVASLTTISTPHFGSKTMDFFMKLPAFLYRFASIFVDLYFLILGDKKPDFFTSSRQFSAILCKEFNEKYPNIPHIYYQSYTAKMKHFFSDPLLSWTNIIIKLIEGDNDGLCPVNSGKWGDFKGVITGKGIWGISHAGVVDLYRFNYSGVDMREIYINIVEELKKKGF